MEQTLNQRFFVASLRGHCAFCKHATHDFKNDVMQRMHDEYAFHTCELKHGFNDWAWCEDFELADGITYGDGETTWELVDGKERKCS